MTTTQIETLISQQEPLIESIANKLDEPKQTTIGGYILPYFVQAPTGIGKTHIIPQVIKKMKNTKKTIIVVPTNQLVFESAKVCNGLYGLNADIVIGYKNYISSNKLKTVMEEEILQKYITQEELDKFCNMKNINEDTLYYDEFDSAVAFINGNEDSDIIKSLICFSASSDVHDNFRSDVSITNSWYFMYRVLNSSNDGFDLSDFNIIVDEVHQFEEIATKVNEKTFSVFHMNTLLKQLMLQPAFGLKQNAMLFDSEWNKSKYMKAIIDLEKRTANIKIKYSDEKMANELVVDKYSNATPVNTYKGVLKRLKNKIITSNLYKIIQANIIKGTLFNNIETGLIADLEKLISDLNFLIPDVNNSKEIYYIQYSPVKGIPVLVSSLNTGRFFLKNKIWNNISNFVGLSGTLSYSLHLDKYAQSFNHDAYKYLFYRLGVATNTELNTNTTLVDVKVQPRIFNRRNVEIYLPNKMLTSKNNAVKSQDNMYSDEFDITKSEYYEERLHSIRKAQELTNHSKNAVVICGGYTEAYIMSERYKELFPSNELILCSNKQEKTNSTINRFLDSGKKAPSILFATRNFGTGVSLAGKALENLYLLRLPYTDQNKFKWATTEGSDTNWVHYQNEMIITFAQNMGRLQRTMNDSGSIFLLDERFYQKSINTKLMDIVNEYGIVQRATIDISNEMKTHFGTTNSTVQANLNEVGEITRRVVTKEINSLEDIDEDLADLF